ncbi:hypothetical protein [Chryseobacterium sp. GP-SGM7]|uniref:hypothetical protein n=1 Tax=Chryseobacterium sp. GP-SGM7 TaxID=3411323 RepID=UPI003B95118D
MNQEILIYNTPTSEEILKQINQYEFKRLWKDNLKNNSKNLFYGILFTLVGTLIILAEGYRFAGFFFGFSLAAFSYYFSYYSSYKKAKKRHEEIIEKEIYNLKTNSKDVIWEYTPSHFSFKSYKAEYSFIWSEITYCILDDKYLYITASSFLNFILEKANIDKENLDKTIIYLENKAKFEEI